MRKFDLDHQVLLVLALVLVALLIIPYADVVAISALSAYFVSGLYHKRRAKRWGKWRSLPLVWLYLISLWTVPISIVGYVGIVQSQEVIRSMSTIAQEATGREKLDQAWSDVYDNPPQPATSGTGNTFQEEAISLLDIAEETLIERGEKQVKRIPHYFIAVMLYMFLVSAFLVHGKYMYNFVKTSLPYSNEMLDMYLAKMTDLLDGIMRGGFIVSLIQGACIGVAWWIAGLPYVLTVTIVSTILYIPMIGASIIVLPAVAYLISQGHITTAVVFFLRASLVVGNIDNVIRDKFLPKGSRLHPALLFLAIVSGMYWFGPTGLFYGPLFAIVAVTTLHTYRDGKIIEDNKNKISQ